jgi:ATP-dependent Clp protease adapter protein ClpS
MAFLEDADPNKERRREVPGEGWAIVLYNDDLLALRHVLCTLRRIVGLSCEAALEVSWQASLKGRAIVTITTYAEAEKIAEALADERLPVDLLPC